MPRTEQVAIMPARVRVGLPVIPDGSDRQPLLLRLPPADGGGVSKCNNGCRECLTLPAEGDVSAWTAEVAGRHVVIRDREATLRRDLPRLVLELKARGPARINLLTNGRILAYPALVTELMRAGVDRFLVKLFGVDATSHDAYTRVEGSFLQATKGIATARSLGARVLVTFPLTPASPAEARAEAQAACTPLARELTGFEPVVMPEPKVEAYASEFQYDLMRLREPDGHRIWADGHYPLAYVNTGPVCNIRCVYCNVEGGDDQRLYARPQIEPVIDGAAEKLLREPARRGVPTLEFIGGDPSLHPELHRLVRYARDKGFRQVTMCSNGVLLLRPGYLDQLVEAGLTGIRFSFHDHRPEVANALADVGGLGNRYLEVAEHLLSRTDLRVYVNRILMANTMDALDEYVHWVAEHNRTGRTIDLALLFPSMRGRMAQNRQYYPRLEGLRERLVNIVDLALSLGIEATLHHTPVCLYPAVERSAPMQIRTLHVSALDGVEEQMNYEGDGRYGRACEGCAARDQGCHGLPGHYFDADPEGAEAWLRPLATASGSPSTQPCTDRT
jgi:MoaA/NifB/PqqE/SkfB family radical SAM enzyme